MSDFVYLDNAATTFPKPPEVIRFMCDFYATRGVNPGRTGFDLALEAEDTLLESRQALTDFFGGTDRNRLVFSLNVTDALNLLIGSVLSPGDHAITTCLEHNSVLRPIAIIGGTHLGYVEDTQIKMTIDALKDLNVAHLIPSHCTGIPVAARLAREFSDIFHFSHVGFSLGF